MTPERETEIRETIADPSRRLKEWATDNVMFWSQSTGWWVGAASDLLAEVDALRAKTAEIEADIDILKGNVTTYKSDEEFLARFKPADADNVALRDEWDDKEHERREAVKRAEEAEVAAAERDKLKADVDALRALLVRAAGMIPPGCQLEEDIADALGEEEKP